MYIIVISGGEYSDYWEHWYNSDEPITHQQLAERLQANYAQAIEDCKTKLTWIKQAQNDECEKLFGTREWPYYLGRLQAEKGTIEEFRGWRDKYVKLKKGCDIETYVMSMCGLTRLSVDLSVDIGGYAYDTFDDSEDFHEFIENLKAKSPL